MIIEGIINWVITVLQYAVSLLPLNGTIFGTIPSLSFSFLKFITLLNGYMPINEIGAVFLIMLSVYASMFAIRITFGIYSQITKLIP